MTSVIQVSKYIKIVEIVMLDEYTFYFFHHFFLIIQIPVHINKRGAQAGAKTRSTWVLWKWKRQWSFRWWSRWRSEPARSQSRPKYINFIYPFLDVLYVNLLIHKKLLNIKDILTCLSIIIIWLGLGALSVTANQRWESKSTDQSKAWNQSTRQVLIDNWYPCRYTSAIVLCSVSELYHELK